MVGYLSAQGAWRPYFPQRVIAGNRTPLARRGGYDRPPMDRGELPATTSLVLLDRIRDGDAAALNELIRRYLPRLSRWAAGRLPTWARDMNETDDLVQDTLARAAAQLGHFEHRHDGALQAYLRRAVMNRIRDE